jgi:hypothetical protein
MGVRKFNLEENFFDIIDTQEKAYFLGFLYADGCNLLHRNRISIGLHEKDYELLKRLNDLILSGNDIKIVKQKNVKGHYINDKFCRNSGNSIYLHINSKYMSQKLNSLGMIPRKSSIVLFPTCVPSYLMNHFIRGYFDGDGSLITNKRQNGFSIKIASSKCFCESMLNVIREHTGVKFGLYNEKDTYSVIILGGIYSSKLFCDWIYKNSSIHMKRKYEKYLMLCERIKTLHKAKYKYVYFNKRFNTWIADVYLGNKKSKRLGDRFPTEQAAYVFQQKWLSVNSL